MTPTPASKGPAVRDPRLLVVGLLAVLLPLIPADLNSPRWHGVKTLTFALVSAVLLGLLPHPIRRAASPGAQTSRPNPLFFLGLLTLWALASYALTPTPDSAFAFNGWWLLAGGLVVSYTVSTRTRSDRDFRFFLDTLTAVSVVVAAAALLLYHSEGMIVAEGTYHDHQLLSAALMILLPMPLTLLTLPAPMTLKIPAAAALALCAMGLMLAQGRSAWISEAVALTVLIALRVWRSRTEAARGNAGLSRRNHQRLIYGLLVLAAVGYFLAASPEKGVLGERARTLATTVLTGHDEAFQWRLRVWNAALIMFHAKPVLGWGVGGYPLHERAFTHQGDAEAAVRAGGAHIGDETHNSYLQLAVELGGPGLALWLLTLGTAFWGGVRALRRLPDGSVRQRVLIGGLSALAGQAVDACADPAWQFGEIAVYSWIILGLVVAASAPPGAATSTEKLRLPFRAAVSAASVWAIVKALASARALPIPHL